MKLNIHTEAKDNFTGRKGSLDVVPAANFILKSKSPKRLVSPQMTANRKMELDINHIPIENNSSIEHMDESSNSYS